MKELPKAYEPGQYEDSIYEKWVDSGFFNPDVCVEKGVTEANAKHFSIVLPPPNVTGTLHIGHASMLAIQDSIVRYHRMKGDRTVWIPGTDHAAIATQTKVEKLLMESGAKDPKKELGREKFLEEVNKFAQESHDTIINQSKKMGSSLDWSREAFTLDEERNLAVRTVFKKMYDDGLIYRGYRIVNWCPRCQSTLADDEVEYKEQKTKFYYFKYGPVIIGTARPETKFLDKTIVVHPDDERYTNIQNKEFDVEWIDGMVKANVIADAVSDPEFGTGAMTITPAHSFEDYNLAQKYNLPIVQIIDENGNFTGAAGSFAGKNARESREEIVEILDRKGLVDHVDENYVHNLSVCYRCGHAIEPMPSKQWFIDVNKKIKIKAKKLKNIKDGGEYSLKELMQTVVKTNQIKIIPDRFEKVYFNWINNLRDWCISRQIWYGHRIPVWYKKARKGVDITFIRHGESQANVEKLYAGHMDSPLTEKGKAETVVLSQKVFPEKYDFVFSSDLIRASDTAEIYFGSHHKNIIKDKRLREIDFGDMTGKPVTEKSDLYRLIGFPNGENYINVRNRMISFLSEMVDKYDGKKIGIVGHSGTWKVLENIFNNTHFHIEHLKKSATREPIEYSLKELVYVDTEAPSGEGWVQDPDTLDTWFSSGLWTFSTLGYPDLDATDLKNYHPTTLMETGYDILFFWVARMILMTTYVLGEIPFETVYLHGLVRDEQGRKMSKSLGNVINPLDTIQKYGADATRLSLVLGNTPGNDLKLSEEKVAGFRNFANKLWNISRFILLKIEAPKANIARPKGLTLADKWILEELDNVIYDATNAFENFQFSFAGEQLREFTWDKLADWYLEIAKVEDDKEEILNYILNTVLKLWHPLIPFVTEAIWQEIYEERSLLLVEKWPVSKDTRYHEAVAEFSIVRKIITDIRNWRAEHKIEPKEKLNAVIFTGASFIRENSHVIKFLGRLEEVVFEEKTSKKGSLDYEIKFDRQVDANKEKTRLQKEIETVEPYINGMEKKLANKQFTGNAPAAVVETEKKKLAEAKEKLIRLNEQLSQIK